MNLKEDIKCPKCSSSKLDIKRKVTYVYTYKLKDEESSEAIHTTEALPFLFDNREKCGSDEYILCENCGASYPISLDEYDKKIDFTILQKAIRADNIENPQFLG